MAAAMVSGIDILDAETVMSLHEHSLQLIDAQRRKDAIELLGLSKTFVCQRCKQLRHRFVRYCAECNARFCHGCYQSALDEQNIIVQQTIEAQQRADDERNRLFAGSAVSTGSSGMPPIMFGCMRGDYALVREMVEKNEFSGTLDLEQLCDSDGAHKGKTMLLLASEFGHRHIVMLLLGRGARSSACDNRGMTSLMLAAHGGHVEVLDELLFAGVEVDQRAQCGYTALLLAASRGHALCVQRLIAAGASCSARTPKGRTPLIVAALNGHKGVVGVLLKSIKPKDVTTTDFEGYSALEAAIAAKHAAVESMLLAWIGSQKDCHSRMVRL